MSRKTPVFSLLHKKALIEKRITVSLCSLQEVIIQKVMQCLPVIRNKIAGHGQGRESITAEHDLAELSVNLAGAFNLFLMRRELKKHPVATGKGVRKEKRTFCRGQRLGSRELDSRSMISSGEWGPLNVQAFPSQLGFDLEFQVIPKFPEIPKWRRGSR